MLQFSVYARLCNSVENAEVHYRRLARVAPRGGSIRCMIVTEKQYAGMRLIAGKRAPDERPAESIRLSFFWKVRFRADNAEKWRQFFWNFIWRKLQNDKQREGICPLFACHYYTIPKLIRELKQKNAPAVGRKHYTIPKLIRELKPSSCRRLHARDYTIPKLIRELKLNFVSSLGARNYTIPKLIRELKP